MKNDSIICLINIDKMLYTMLKEEEILMNEELRKRTSYMRDYIEDIRKLELNPEDKRHFDMYDIKYFSKKETVSHEPVNDETENDFSSFCGELDACNELNRNAAYISGVLYGVDCMTDVLKKICGCTL